MAPSDERNIRTNVIIDAWRQSARRFPGVEFLTIRAAQGGPPGREIDVRISGGDLASLKKAVEETRKLLISYPGVSAVADNVEVRDVVSVDIVEDRGMAFQVLFDPEHGLEERILSEQFVP